MLEDGTADFRAKTDATASPLARRPLFRYRRRDGCFLGSDFISVTKGPAEWQHLKPMVLGAIMEHYMSGATAVEKDGANDGEDGNYDPKDADNGLRPSRNCSRRACVRLWLRTAATSSSQASATA